MGPSLPAGEGDRAWPVGGGLPTERRARTARYLSPAAPSPSRGNAPTGSTSRALVALEACRREQGLHRHARRLEALPHHLAALAEGGACHRFEVAHADVAGRPASAPGGRPLEVTFGGGVKRVAADVEGDARLGAPAAEHAEPAVVRRSPGLATMRSATSRWNISVSDVEQRRPGLGGEPADQQLGADIVGQVRDDARRAVGQRAHSLIVSASPEITSSRPG